ncbi:MAG: single-stranded DNA-binding protein [Clostridia bacterium]|nr:single-stranded DNA-binding protein [Clostridia bacterium]
MNKVILIGNLTRDPELTETPNGVSVCRFDIAVNRDYANADGQRETDFFHITVWRNRAENCAKYLKKGNKVAVCGTLNNRSYDDKDGITRYVTDVVAEDVEFLTPMGSNSPAVPAGADKYDKPVNDSTAESDKGKKKATEKPQLEVIDDSRLPF